MKPKYSQHRIYTSISQGDLIKCASLYPFGGLWERGAQQNFGRGGGRMWVILGGTIEASSRVERKAMSAWGPGD